MVKKLSIVVSFILILTVSSLLFTGCVPKKSSSSSSSSSTTTSTTNNAITTLEKRVSAIEANIANMNNIDETNFAKKEDLASLQAKTATLETRNAELEQELVILQEDYDALVEQLNEEEEANEDLEDVDPEDAVDVEVKYFPTYTALDTKTQISIPVKIKLSNTLPVNLNEVYVDIAARVTSDLNITKMELVGGSIVWQGSTSGSRAYFSNWDEIKLKADERETISLNLVVTYDNLLMTAPVDLTVSISGECEDFQVV